MFSSSSSKLWSGLRSRGRLSLLIALIALISWAGLSPWHAARALEPVTRALEIAPGAEWIRIEPPELPGAQLPPPDLDPADRSDAWINSTYAFGGSALSNGLIVLSVVVMSLILEATSPESENYLDITGPGTISLMALSAAGTPLLMHLWSPQTEGELFVFSGLGSLAASGAVLLAMVLLGLVFNQGSFNDTFYTLLPSAFILAVLLQGLGSAWGHELGEELRRGSTVSHAPPGSKEFGIGPAGSGLQPPSSQGLVLLKHRWAF